MNKEEKLPAGENRVPDKEPSQEQTVNEVAKADATKDEEISSTEPVTQTEQASITNLQSEKEMEVHHHTHPGHHKKTWKDYFWEFLMLFLAVFCGFLAEYQLEHKIEKNREKQFITSLAADLQDDVNALDAIMNFERIGIKQLDSLMHFLNNPTLAKQNGDQLYYVARIGPRVQPFANNSRTFDQLRYSGGFRLIRSTESSNNIMGYYNQFSLVRLLEDNYSKEFDNYKLVAAKVFDPAILRRQESDLGEILTSNDNPSLQTNDARLLKEVGFHVLQMNGSRRSRLVLLAELKTTAVNLKSYLQKEYHLE